MITLKQIKWLLLVYISTFLSAINCSYLSKLSPDYYSYSGFYNNISNNNFFSSTRFEPAYVFLNFISSYTLEFDFTLFIFLVSLFSILIKLYYVSTINSKHIAGYILLYSLSVFTILDVVSIRTGIASTILIASLAFLAKDRKYISFILITIATLFHYSIALLTVVYVIKYLLSKGSKLLTTLFMIIVPFACGLLLNFASTIASKTLLSSYLTEIDKAPSILSFYNIFIAVLFLSFLIYVFEVPQKLIFIYFSALFLYLFCLASSDVAVIYFRYVDLAILLLIIYFVSINKDKRYIHRYYLSSILMYSFAGYKLLSTYLFSQIIKLPQGFFF